MKTITPRSKCQWQGCQEKATTLAYGGPYNSHRGMGRYCNDHARRVVEEDRPEYHRSCPNCGCEFGVG